MTKRAVLIGINYKGSDNELRGCINDINSIQKLLIEQGRYHPRNIRVLTEEPNRISPTRANIELNLKWLISTARSGDTLLFYYSGHGSYTRDATGDESDKRDEVLIPLDSDTNGVITDDWLFDNVVSKVPRKVSLRGFTDCCHSGTVLDLKYNYKGMCILNKPTAEEDVKVYVPEEWTEKFTLGIEKSKSVVGDVCLFSGCRDSQTSADAYIANTFQGAFSYCLMETIQAYNIAERRRPGDRDAQRRGDRVLPTKRAQNRTMLKDIWCRLVLNGFKGQDCQFSCSQPESFERAFAF